MFFFDEKWIEELAAAIPPEEIPVYEMRGLSEVVGVEAAIKTFRYFMGVPYHFPAKDMEDMKREYLKRCSAGKSDRELARKLGVTKRHVEKVLSQPAKTSAYYIPMFPDLE